MKPLIAQLRSVTKRFGAGTGAFTALSSIDMDVRAGEVLMISGPSGSGKTTCLSILGCVLRATSGRVTLLGRDVSSLSEQGLAETRLTCIGFVFQSHNLLASLTTTENVAFVGCLRGMAKHEATARARDLLDRVGLAAKAENLPADLSGGERQRVGIARALIGDPPLLLADEPTAALDAANGLAVSQLLRAQAKEHGRAVAIVTHDPRIFHLAERRIEIEDGRIAREAA